MKHLLLQKILALVAAIARSANGWVNAVDFDNNDPAAKLPGDPRGRNWNAYVHANAPLHGFEIIKIKNRNYYVRIGCRAAFLAQFKPLP